MDCSSHTHIFQIPAYEEAGWVGEVGIDGQEVPSSPKNSVT